MSRGKQRKDTLEPDPGSPGARGDPSADGTELQPAGAATEEDQAAPQGRAQAEAFPVVGVGASAGGLEAFTQLLTHLRPDTGMAFVLVQHLDPDHESALTQILGRSTALPVHAITAGLPVAPDQVYVIPPNTDLSIERGILGLRPRKSGRVPHRPIDSFFESLARDLGGRAIGVVLSGTATDGTLGLEAIKSEGGITFAQDGSAKQESMPRSAIAAGVVDFVLSPQEIAAELTRIAKHPFVAGPTPRFATAGGAPASAGGEGNDAQALRGQGRDKAGTAAGDEVVEEDDYGQALLLLRNHSGVDFSQYRSTTIQRRIARRVVLAKQDDLAGYVRHLRDNANELDLLYSDVLISVTSFFRNPEVFEAVQHQVMPALLAQRGDGPIRAWVLGCSTGQEAYSLAISFLEAAEKSSLTHTFQIFATDLNNKLLAKARHGLYAKSIDQDLAPERLRRFFVEEEGGYRIRKAVREMVVFAQQDLISDPPFSRMDLISCRNLLIYLEPGLQEKALRRFHYALKPHGFLLLGVSESIGRCTDLFEPVDKKHRIHSRKPAAAALLPLPAATNRLPIDLDQARAGSPWLRASKPGSPEYLHGMSSAQQEADRITIDQFAPAGVLVDADLQVLQFRGTTGAYLEHPVGKASFDVLKMAREGLMLPLHAAIHEARTENRTACRDNIRIHHEGRSRTLNLRVVPLQNLREPCFLILFDRATKPEATIASEPTETGAAPPSESEGAARRIAELEQELAEMRAYLQAMREVHEAGHEEIQAANEEIQSANEELQSINEELETSKEELESANEELITVNDEMGDRNVELTRVNDDLVNLQASTRLAIMLVGRDLMLRRFSSQAEQQFELLATDIGRPLGHVRHRLVLAGGEHPVDLGSLAAETIDSVRARECTVRDARGAGHWYSLALRPYITLDNRVDGVVLVLSDINDLKNGEQAVAAARDYAEHIIDTVPEPLLVLDAELRVKSVNQSFYSVFRVDPEQTIGQRVYDLGNRQWDIPRLRELLENILPDRTEIQHFRVEQDFETIGKRTMLVNARKIHDPEQESRLILLAFEDVTERERSKSELVESEAAYRTLVDSVRDYAIFRTDLEGCATTWNIGVERVLGFTAEEFIGKPIDAIVFTPEDIENRVPHDELQTAAGTGVADNTRWMRRKNGEHFFAQGVTTAIRDERGRLIGFTKVMRDQTGSKELHDRLHASELRYRRLFESAKDGVLVLDATTGRILEANLFVCELLALDRNHMVGKTLHEVGLFPDVAANERALLRIRESGYLHCDRLPIENQRGEAIDIEFIISVHEEESRLVAQGNIRDITERLGLQQKIVEQAAAIADESRRKDEFLSMLSHELRNPLAPISAAIHLLGLHDSSGDETQRRARDIIERQMANLTKLVGDLLEISRVVSGRIRLECQRMELHTTLQHAIESVQPLIDQHAHTVILHPCTEPGGIWVHADPTRMEEVFINLLNNAAKYTPDGGRIDVWCEPTGSEPGIDRAQVRVRDDGIGIPSQLLPHIFDLFTQGDRTLARSAGGLGVGLCLAHRLVDLHDGSIAVTSPPDGMTTGSEFVVCLLRVPTRDVKHRDDPVVGARTGPADGVRVLLVDDNVDLVVMLASTLRHKGYSVETAYDGPDGLEIARHWHPDVVLLDIGLPGMDGYEVARQLREDRQNFPPLGYRGRLVALTGYGRDADLALTLEAGFDGHLVKPCSFEELEGLLTFNRRQED